MKRISRTMKRLLAILIVEIIVAVNAISTFASTDSSIMYSCTEESLQQGAAVAATNGMDDNRGQDDDAIVMSAVSDDEEEKNDGNSGMEEQATPAETAEATPTASQSEQNTVPVAEMPQLVPNAMEGKTQAGENEESEIREVDVNVSGVDGILGGTVELATGDENAKVVISGSSESSSTFENAYTGEGSVKGALVFDMELKDEEDNKMSLEGTAKVQLRLSADVFGTGIDAEQYLIMHKTSDGVEQLGAFDSLGGISFTTSSFSPFAVVAVSQGTNNTGVEEGKNYEIENWITDVTMYVKKDDTYEKVTADSVLSNNDIIKVEMEFEVPDDINITSKDTLVYDIPDFVSNLQKVDNGKITDKDGTTTIGSYKLEPAANGKGGRLTLRYDESYFENGGTISFGGASFEGVLDVTEVEGETTVEKKIGNFPFSVRTKEEYEQKTGTLTIEKTKRSTGTPGLVDYTVEIKAPQSNTKDIDGIVFRDYFTDGADLVKEITTGVYASWHDINGHELSETEKNTSRNRRDVQHVEEDGKTISWKIGTMKPGDVIRITYSVQLDTSKVPESDTVTNKAVVSAKGLDDISAEAVLDITSNVDISKQVIEPENGLTGNGAYDYENHTITYEVSLDNYGIFPVTVAKVVDEFYDEKGDSYGAERFVKGYKDIHVLQYNQTTRTLEEVNGVKWTEDESGKKITFENITIPAAGRTGSAQIYLRYTVEIEDYSADPDTKKEDIWQHKDMREWGDNICCLWNRAEMYLEKDAEPVKNAKYAVTFSKQMVTKKYCEKSVNGNPVFEIGLNAGDINHIKESRYNMSGWTVHDRLGAPGEWKIVPESVKIYYYDEYVESADVETGRHLAANTGLKMVDASGVSGFDYTIPESLGMKYIIIRYEVCSRNETVPGQMQKLSNDVILEGIPGVPGSSTGTSVDVVMTSALSKKAVSCNGQEIRWRSEVGTNIKNGMKYYDWIRGDHALDFEDLELEVTTPDGKVLPMGEDTWQFEKYSDKEFRITFKKAITATAEKPVVITYKTKPSKKTGDVKAKNYAKIYDFDKVNQIVFDEANYTITPGRDIQKEGKGCDIAEGTQKWDITINAGGNMTGKANILEALPEGTELVSAEITTFGDVYKNREELALTTAMQLDGNARLTVEGLKKNGSVTIRVVTKFKEEKMEEFRLNNKLTITNKAVLLGENGENNIETSAVQTISRKVLKKIGDYADGIATYSIIVNEDGVDLLPEETTITLIDEMDSMLELCADSVVVTDENGKNVDYKANLLSPNKFEVTIPDDRCLTISYRAYVKGAIGTEYENVSNKVSFVGYETVPGETTTIKNLVVQKSSVYSGGYAVTIKKVGENLEPLAGAQFQIYHYYDGEWKEESIVTTDSKGEAIIKVKKADIENGNCRYAYREIKAPQGYALDSNLYEINVVPNKELPDGESRKNAYPIGSQILVLNKKEEVKPTPTPIPESTPTPAPEGTPTPTPDAPTPTPGVTPIPGTTPTPGNQEPTPGTPTPTPQTPGQTPTIVTPPGRPQVLGAYRIRGGGAVLGARRGMDYAVLGKRRRPSTGDSAAMVVWMLTFGGALGGACVATLKLRKGARKKHVFSKNE